MKEIGFCHDSSLTDRENVFSFKCIGKMSRIMTKLTKWHVCPAKTQISLVICQVWSVFATTDSAHSKDSDHTGWMPRLIWVFAGCTCHFVGFVMRRLKFKNKNLQNTKKVSQTFQFQATSDTLYCTCLFFLLYCQLELWTKSRYEVFRKVITQNHFSTFITTWYHIKQGSV